MTVYAIVQLEISDREAYDQYQAKFWSIFKKHDGRLLVSDENPEVFEGEWSKDKVVIISFPDKASFKDWATSPQYLKIAKHRHLGSTASIVLAEEFSLSALDGVV